MTQQAYSLAFTAGSLRIQDSLKIGRLYLKHKDWKVVREQVISENHLQQRTESSSRRLYEELASRLKCLSDAEIETFVEGSQAQKIGLLWLATRRRYMFLQDFFDEVVREHTRNLNYQLDHGDFDIFFNSKLGLHDELNEISDSTRRKIRQVTFRMLREAGLLNADNMINPVSELLKSDPERNHQDRH